MIRFRVDILKLRVKRELYTVIALLLCWCVSATANDSIAIDTVVVDTVVVDTVPSWDKQMAAELNRMLNDKLLQTSEVAIMIWDLTADSCIYRYQERQRMRPASTMKVITAITALDQLGDDYECATELRYTGRIREYQDAPETLDSLETQKEPEVPAITKRALYGNLYCVGCMDPLFGDSDIKAFANAVKQLTVDSIIGGLYADRSFKDRKPYGEGWCWDDDNPTLSALLLNRKDRVDDELRNRIRNSGIVLWTNAGDAQAPTGSILICRREHKLTDVLRPMMKKSDNLFAECVFYQIAHRQGGKGASADDARKSMEKVIRKVGLDAGDYTIADGSGLSLYNYVSAELETLLLRYAYQHRAIYGALLPTLPIAGVDGTLADRMNGAKVRGNVRAKTGTVAGVSSLAGYCTAANGHQLCFSIINQGIKNHKPARAFQDRVCAVMCR